MVDGRISTRGSRRRRFTFHDVGSVVNPYSPRPSGASHTGVATGVPSRRKVVKLTYFGGAQSLIASPYGLPPGPNRANGRREVPGCKLWP